MTALQIESKGNAAIQALRLSKLKEGHPFMINSKDLPTNICYLEYPDGTISLATFKSNDRHFTIIRNLTEIENQQVRIRFNLTVA